jgi:hypothetical protein
MENLEVLRLNTKGLVQSLYVVMLYYFLEEEINERFLQLKKNREELLDSKKSYNQTR